MPGAGAGAGAVGEDTAELQGYVEIWWQAVGDLCALLDELEDDDWQRPTDLAGWDVRACAAHTAHLESRLAGADEETADIGEPAHVTGLMGMYTEIGVVNRRETPPADIVAELRRAAAARHDALLADPPTDADAQPEHCFGGVPWSWRTLLRNRPLDVWMHEQDVRRAVGRPGNLDGPAARHSATYLAESLGFVLAKKVGAPAGTTLLLEIDDQEPIAFVVGEDGRGRRLDVPPHEPTTTLRTDRESFVLLAGGRGTPSPDRVAVEGDPVIGATLLARLAVTP